jgi:hypothetical protein
LFLIFWLAYAVLFIGEYGISAIYELIWNRKFHLAHGWRMIVSALFVIFLFIEWMRRSPEDFGNYGTIHSPPGASALVFYDGAFGAFSMLLANPQASASMITEILYVGPRLVLGAGTLARAARGWQKLDFADCARALEQLAASNRAVTDEDFLAMRPDMDWIKTKSDLARIPGLVILEKGVSLTEELRDELSALVNHN